MVWQSGCSGAKQMFSKMAEIQSKYSNKGLDLVYFSLDEDKTSWKETSTNYKIPAINISDLQGFNGKTALKFGITAIPFFLILDKEKKVRLVTFGDEMLLLDMQVEKILHEK